MFKKLLLLVLIVSTILFAAGCGRTIVIRSRDCDCESCDCSDERERNDDPGEYEGWRD